MARLGKYLSLFLVIILAASSLLMIQLTNAQTIPKPSVPEFSLAFVDNSYDVSTTTSIDPYTGQTITNQGHHVQRVYLVMTIENQPLAYQYNGSFYYNLKVKGHYEQWNEWSEWFKPDELPRANVSSSQTLITLGELSQRGLAIDSGSREIDIPYGGSVDFQVKAMIGNIGKNLTEGPAGSMYFAGQISEWSNTQTVTIGENTNNPSPSPTVPEFPITATLVTVLVAVSLLMVISKIKVSINH
jgi:hypothetical protein